MCFGPVPRKSKQQQYIFVILIVVDKKPNQKPPCQSLINSCFEILRFSGPESPESGINEDNLKVIIVFSVDECEKIEFVISRSSIVAESIS